jgi:septal ring-binding cell division protein DamX
MMPNGRRLRAAVRPTAIATAIVAVFFVGKLVIGPALTSRLSPKATSLAPVAELHAVTLTRTELRTSYLPCTPVGPQVTEDRPPRAITGASVQDSEQRELAPVQAPSRIAEPGTSSTTPNCDYTVSAGSYSKQRNADKVARTIADHGYRVTVRRAMRGGTLLFVVQVGPFTSINKAEAAVMALQEHEIASVVDGTAPGDSSTASEHPRPE